jgi:hypothetical protein
VIHPYDKRYKTTFDHMRFPNLASKYYSDTMFTKLTSVRQNNIAQIFIDGKGDTQMYPLKRKSHVGSTLMSFIQDVGVPRYLVTDGAKEETLGKWKETQKKFRIKQHTSEPYSQWQNRAEYDIGDLKRMMSHHRRQSNSPKRLWYYLGKWCAAVKRLTAKPSTSDCRVPCESNLLTPQTYQCMHYSPPTLLCSCASTSVSACACPQKGDQVRLGDPAQNSPKFQTTF